MRERESVCACIMLPWPTLLTPPYTHSTHTHSLQVNVPPGALITFLQKGLEYVGVEEHINEDGSVKPYQQEYSLLSPFICDAVAAKEDRRVRRVHASGREGGGGDGSDDSPKGSRASGSGSSRHDVSKRGTSSAVKTENGGKLLHLSGHLGEVFMCLWNPVTHQLASGSADGVCRLWGLDAMDSAQWSTNDTEIGLRSSILPHCANVGDKFKDVTSVVWSPDGKSLATGCYDGTARVWDASGALKATLREHTGPLFSMRWNTRGDLLLTGSYDKLAIVWDAKLGTVLKSYQLHKAPVLDVSWKDSDTFAMCSSDHSIHICAVSSSGSSSQRQLLGHKVALCTHTHTSTHTLTHTNTHCPHTHTTGRGEQCMLEPMRQDAGIMQ